MALTKVSSVSELPPGAVKEIEAGGSTYAVCNIEGTLHCVEGLCPHAGGPLGQGTLNGNHLVCPWHAYEFDCRTGVNDMDEDMQVQTYAVVVQDGDILIDIP
jgi:nitrite reductase/ring-hydroxylating ferredoxin subunit